MSATSPKGLRGPVLDVVRDGGSVTATVCPKINLFLELVRRRDDGFHELSTVFAAAFPHDSVDAADAWIDRVRVSPAAGDADQFLFCGRTATTLADVAPERTTVHAVVAGLRKRGVDIPPVSVEVEKQIPVEAGLGGGSADAAATLVALESRFDLDVDDDVRLAIAREVGADVPYFLADEAVAIGVDRGDRIERFEGAPFDGDTPTVVLVKPAFGVSTAGVFSSTSFPLTDPSGPLRLPRAELSSSGTDPREGWTRGVFNRLEPIARRVEPRLDDVRREIDVAIDTAGVVSSDATIWMTGSGSTFVIAGLDPDRAVAVRSSLERASIPDDRVPERGRLVSTLATLGRRTAR